MQKKVKHPLNHFAVSRRTVICVGGKISSLSAYSTSLGLSKQHTVSRPQCGSSRSVLTDLLSMTSSETDFPRISGYRCFQLTSECLEGCPLLWLLLPVHGEEMQQRPVWGIARQSNRRKSDVLKLQRQEAAGSAGN